MIWAGHSIQITCHVPRRSTNRWVEWGILNYTSRTRQLDGDQAPMTFQQLFDKVDCEAEEAYCAVTSTDRSVELVKVPFEIADCGDR